MLVFSILELKFKFFWQYRVAKHKRYLHKQNCFLRQKCHQTKEFRRRTIGTCELIMHEEHNFVEFSSSKITHETIDHPGSSTAGKGDFSSLCFSAFSRAPGKKPEGKFRFRVSLDCLTQYTEID